MLNGNTIATANGEKYLCEIRGALKKKYKILIGDYVEICKDNASDKYIITKIYDRLNSLLRPPLANLEQLFIVIAKKPEPDLTLVDKLIIYCFKNNISPILVLNKKDLFSQEEIDDLKKQYISVVDDFVVVSAMNNETECLKEFLGGKLSAFVGQSAVGKSTIINNVFPDLNLRTNGLSKKIDRGKHTTRHSEIFIDNEIKIVDTPGFSMLDLLDVEPSELSDYYPDFSEYVDSCIYNNCTHINTTSKECGVVDAVFNNQLSKDRYERYCLLYKNLLEKWRKRYD